MFEAVGLEPTEGRAYRALLRLPAASPAELAEHLDLSPAEVADRLRAMERKGLVSHAPDGPDRFRATPPDLAFGPALQRQQQELQSIQHAVDRLVEEYRSRVALRGAGELIEVVHGAEAIAHRVTQLQLGARKEVMGLVKPPNYAVAANDNVAEDAALAAGVRYRAVYDAVLLDLPGDPYQIAEGIRHGEEARVAVEVPVKMVLADRALAIVPIASTESPEEPSAVLVHPSGLLEALVALFEQIWATAIPLLAGQEGAVHQDRSADTPSPRDLHLLSLLLAGLTDQAIAAQLGTSTRTVQRRVHDLIEMAGARTRLQLIWQAAHRGWL